MDKDRANELSKLLKDPKLCDLAKELLEKLREIKKYQGQAAFEQARAKVILRITKEAKVDEGSVP